VDERAINPIFPVAWREKILQRNNMAAINMDRSGTTRIGKYLLNHSFTIPGWIGVMVSTIVAYGLAQVWF